MLRKADRETATVPRTRKLGLRDDPDVLPRRTRRPRSLSVPNTPLDSQARDLGRQLHKKTDKSPHHRRRPGGSPGRRCHSAAASTTPPPLHRRGGECAARLLPPVRAGGGSRGKGRRNHRRQKVVPAAAAAALGHRKQEGRGSREYSPSATLLRAFVVLFSIRYPLRGESEEKLKCAGSILDHKINSRVYASSPERCFSEHWRLSLGLA
uniref:uncharacterized protein LOC120885839 n=1 Tax=Ictidomys tridecemlineatus TaxID=43179 RepID=UPI001A9D6E85|nr:uncharacterized protein LOC120885839 [Ictidomys tridecemlineatus]